MVSKKRASKFNISNKLAYTLIVILSIVLIGVGVYAYGGSAPSTMGHSAGELAPPASCTAGQTLTWSGSAWTCLLLNPTSASWTTTQPDGTSSTISELKVGGIGYISGNIQKTLTGAKYYFSPPGVFFANSYLGLHPGVQWYALGMDAENNQVCKVTIKTDGGIYISGPAGNVICYFSTSFPLLN